MGISASEMYSTQRVQASVLGIEILTADGTRTNVTALFYNFHSPIKSCYTIESKGLGAQVSTKRFNPF